MLENKNAQAIFLGILTTALTRIFGMSATDSTILGGLIIGLARFYFSVNDWVKSINNKFENQSTEISKLKTKLSHFSTEPSESASAKIDSDVQNTSENNTNFSFGINITNGSAAVINGSNNPNDSSTINLNDNIIQAPISNEEKQ
ncbi:hypothetical protein [Weissella confusa]|uniref:hypothetical protein n=1 Tax=Weissella confusa TaxID=1583 RepID=UPI0018985852|nr:hypothetical protein [Weissella confusa]